MTNGANFLLVLITIELTILTTMYSNEPLEAIDTHTFRHSREKLCIKKIVLIKGLNGRKLFKSITYTLPDKPQIGFSTKHL